MRPRPREERENRVIEWDRDGITIEADQRHVREIMKGIELERANNSATPCDVERRDESKGENRCGRGQTKYRWNDMHDDDNRDRPRMVDDDAIDSQALTGGDVTRYRALVVRISYLSQDRPDLKFAAMQVCCAMANPTVRDSEPVKRIGRYLAGRPRAKCWFRWQQSGELEAYSDADWGDDKATRRSVSGEVIMRGGHCLKVWTKKQQVVSLSSAESELCAAVKTASGGLGEQSVAKELGHIVWAEPTLGRLGNDGLGQSQRAGQSEARRHAESVDTGAIQVRQVRHEEGRHEREPSRLTKPLPKPRVEQLMSLMGYDFVKGETGALKGRAGGEMRLQQEIFREYLGAILARLMKGYSAASLGSWLWVTVSSTLRVDVSAVHPGKECIG